MNSEKILVVDDEKNIRLTLSQTLEDEGYEVATAINGDEALQKIEQDDYRVILLDLRMPGLDGMAVMNRLAPARPDLRFVIITAHGTIENAVEAMKLGAVDFLQKPFTPQEVRTIVRKIVSRDTLVEEKAREYDEFIELAKRSINHRKFRIAEAFLKKASAIEPQRPEVFNLLGVIAEIHGDKVEATNHYRSAYWIDPTYEPSRGNLERITTIGLGGGIDLGKEEERNP